MLNPVKACSIQFVSDGVSTAMTVDMSVQPASLDLRGCSIAGVTTPAITASDGGSVPSGVTVTGAGTQLIFTFSTAPRQQNVSGQQVLYTLTFNLVLSNTQSLSGTGFGQAGFGL